MRIRKMRILSWLTTLVMLVSLLEGMMLVPSAAADANGVWDGTSDTTWYNSTDTSFTLTTPEQLAGLASIVNQDQDTFEGKTILLGADISLNEGESTANEWIPIGQYVTGGAVTSGSGNEIEEHYFKGNFNGCGHMVRGLYVDNSSGADDACERNGLFAMNSGTIENVGVTGTVKTYRCGGSIAGYNTGTVKYCYGGCTISANGGGGRRGSGGVVGQNFGLVEFCWSDSDVYNAYRRAGGIVGYNCAKENANDPGAGCISNCWFVGHAESKSTPETVTSPSSAYDSSIVATNDSIVENCYYLTGSSKSGYGTGYGTGSAVNVEEINSSGNLVSDSSVSVASKLTAFSTAVEAPDEGASSSYPVLYWQKSGYVYEDPGTAEVTVVQPESGGTVTASAVGTLAWGTDLTLSQTLEEGYKFLGYTVNGVRYQGEHLNVTKDLSISAEYQALSGSALTLADTDVYSLSAKDSSGNTIQSGEKVSENETITVSLSIKPGVMPEDVDYSYNGRAIFSAGETALNTTAATSASYKMGEEPITISAVPDTSRKEWIELADTSWYKADQETFTLTTPQQLAGVAKLIRDGTTCFEEQTILLGNDIDLSNPDGTTGKRCWSSIGSPVGGTTVGNYSYMKLEVPDSNAFSAVKVQYGQLFTDSSSGSITSAKTTYEEGVNYYARCQFMGTFDGQNHEISNFYYNFDKTDTWYGGLFGSVMRATICNVSLSGEMVGSEKKTSAHAGAVVAYANDGTMISGCTGKVDIRLTGTLSSLPCGGILGDAYVYSPAEESCQIRMSDCTNYAEISSVTSYAGGIAGKLFPGSISNCMNFGSVTARDNVGGIAGSAYTNNVSDLLISQCGNEGSVTATVTGTAASTTAKAGGIVGNAGYNITIDQCFNHGHINGGDGNSVGGIAGRLSANNSTTGNRLLVISCYNSGIVESGFNGNSSNVTTNNGIGGLVGLLNNANEDSCMNSYNVGIVRSTKTPTAKVYIGGIVGLVFTKKVVDVKGYYLSASEDDKGVGLLATSNALHKGTESTVSKTQEEMQSPEFLALLGDNFKAASVINNQYPILQWETDAESHTIDVSTVENGTCSVSVPFAQVGEQVNVTAAPADGYLIDSVTCTAEDQSVVEVTNPENGVCSFTMPDQNVTVSVSFKEDPTVVVTVFGKELTMAKLLAHPTTAEVTDVSGKTVKCTGITLNDLAQYNDITLPDASSYVTVTGNDGSGDYVKTLSCSQLSNMMLAWESEGVSTKGSSTVRLVVQGTARGSWVNAVKTMVVHTKHSYGSDHKCTICGEAESVAEATIDTYCGDHQILLYTADALPSEGKAYQAGGQILTYVPAYATGESEGKYVFAGLVTGEAGTLAVTETEGSYLTASTSGDVNGNGTTNIVDAQAVCYMVNQKAVSSTTNLDWFSADVNASRNVTMLDARAIQYYVHFGTFGE